MVVWRRRMWLVLGVWRAMRGSFPHAPPSPHGRLRAHAPHLSGASRDPPSRRGHKGRRRPGVGSSSGGARLRLNSRSILRAQTSPLVVSRITLRGATTAAPCAAQSSGAVGARGRKDDGPVKSGKSRSADASCAASFSLIQ